MKENLFTLCLLATGSNYLLVQTLKSIQDQSCKNREVLLVCHEEFATSHTFPSFVRIVHPDSDNPAAYANKAIKEAKGDFLFFFLPGESFLFSEALQFAQETIEKSPGHSIYQFGYMDHPLLLQKATFLVDMLREGKLYTKLCSTAISREFLQLNRITFDEGFPHRLSFAFFCQLMRKAENPFSESRVIAKGKKEMLSFPQKLTYIWETFFIIQKYFGLFSGLGYLVKPFSMFKKPFKPAV